MPCPFTGPKMFCAGPNFLSQPKNLTAFSASSKSFVPAPKPILLNANHVLFWHKSFLRGAKCCQIFWLAQKIWISTKYFGTCKRTRHKTSRVLEPRQKVLISNCFIYLLRSLTILWNLFSIQDEMFLCSIFLHF